MNKQNRIFLTSLCMTFTLLSSCVNNQQIAPESLKQVTKSGIAVVESEDTKPRFTVIGTTAFNNEFGGIKDQDVSFARYLVDSLKDKGYPAYLTTTPEHDICLKLHPTYPYGNPGMTGVGFHRRSFLSMSSPIVAFCNMRGALEVTQNGKKSYNYQPVNYGVEKGYSYKPTSIDREVDSWNELTASEKKTLIKELQPLMKEQADLILSQLGF
ncbi:hypothetical protein [Rubritalea marina]|uniref:hypothetical protein n=1 Tax=Rubritalea marina TaxID=361055 RepID=UPI00036FCAF2|nr:hypothetical protein [Rubritalea marina]